MHLLCFTNQFWIDFWPNFASTLAGLLIGIPVALATNRWLEKKQNKRVLQSQRANFNVALQIIEKAISANKKRLIDTKTILEQNNIQADTQLDTSSWDVIRNDIILNLRDPSLLQHIAFYFFKVENLKKNHDTYFNLISGVNAAMQGQDHIKENLKQLCVGDAAFLLDESDKLLISLEALKPSK